MQSIQFILRGLENCEQIPIVSSMHTVTETFAMTSIANILTNGEATFPALMKLNEYIQFTKGGRRRREITILTCATARRLSRTLRDPSKDLLLFYIAAHR